MASAANIQSGILNRLAMLQPGRNQHIVVMHHHCWQFFQLYLGYFFKKRPGMVL